MSIGLYDHDSSRYGATFFNLELMKMSTYYKKHNELTTFVMALDLDKYTKTFLRKDYDDGVFPKQLRDPRLNYGGLAFTGNIYIPLDPEIEIQKPDKLLYTKVADRYKSAPERELFLTMNNYEHLRLSLDGKTIWKDFEKQFEINDKTRGIILHDPNFTNIDGSEEVVKWIIDKLPDRYHGKKLGMKFPIEVDNTTDFLKWFRFNIQKHCFSIIYKGLMEDCVVAEIVESDGGMQETMNFEYQVTEGCSSDEEFAKVFLPKIFAQTLFFRRNKKFFPLIYRENFFQDKRFETLIGLLSYYITNSRVYRGENVQLRMDLRSFYDYLNYYQHCSKEYPTKYSVQDCRDALAVVYKYNYPLFSLFYKPLKAVYKGGVFEYEYCTNQE